MMVKKPEIEGKPDSMTIEPVLPDQSFSPSDCLILMVDDDPLQLHKLKSIVEAAGYRVRSFEQSIEAWAFLVASGSSNELPMLILSDITMPDMDGYQFCTRIKGTPGLTQIPVLFLSALSETLDKVRSFQVGGADFINKPYQAEEVLARIKHQLLNHFLKQQLRDINTHLNQIVAEQVKELTASTTAMLHAFAAMVENRDNETGRHIERISQLCGRISRLLSKLPQWAERIDAGFIETIEAASPLHDIGKVGIPDSILLKPGKLEKTEFDVIKTHTTLGAQTIRKVLKLYPNSPSLVMGLDLVRGHHERWDGQGYPDGLAGEAIPLSARITALADVYDALRSYRVYKPKYSHAKSMEIMTQGNGQFDPEMLAVFVEHASEIEELWALIENRQD